MRIEEARHLTSLVKKFPVELVSPCLNIGSSTLHFRQVTKPHITKEFLAPLQAAGIKFIHADLKPGNGIDICGDLFDKNVQRELKNTGAKSLMLNNVLEHVKEPNKLASLCTSLVPKGGYLFVTVPHSYPYHADPIDTMYRPTPQELANLFKGTELIHSELISDGNAWSDLFGRNANSRKTAKFLVRLALPLYKPRVWLAHVHRLSWLARPYKISMVVLQRR